MHPLPLRRSWSGFELLQLPYARFTLQQKSLPYQTVRCEVDLQLEIADVQGRPIVTYSAPGVGKAKVALYYGYSSVDAVRKANLAALQAALKAIETKLQVDVPALAAQLDETLQR